MKQSEIKTECELIYTQIENLNDRLTRLRSICKHENTYDGIYSWRVGVMQQTRLCCDCNSVISPDWQKLGEINREEI